MIQGRTAFRREKFLIEGVFFGFESASVQEAALGFSFAGLKERSEKHALPPRRKFLPPEGQTSVGNPRFLAMAVIK
jgi:hypothetical protein